MKQTQHRQTPCGNAVSTGPRLFLSLLVVDTRREEGRRLLGNPYRVHQQLLNAFSDGAFSRPLEPLGTRLLFRVEEWWTPPRVLVQSPLEADWHRAFVETPVLAKAPCQKPYAPALEPGQVLRFFLRANPTVRRASLRSEGKRLGPRLGLVHEPQQRDWLERRAAAGGFDLLDYRVMPRGKRVGWQGQRDRSPQLTHLCVDFEGFLQVTDPDQFLRTLAAGIGPAKAFGFGLLSVAPAR